MLRDLVIQNRSYRGFDRSRRIKREELLELVDNTRYCPSSLNHQVLKYSLLYDEETVSAIMPLTGWAMALKEVRLPLPGKEPVAFVLISMDTTLMAKGINYIRDVGIAAQTILLGAVEKGLGGVMLGSFNKEKLSSLLNLPSTLEPNLLIALGKPDDEVVLTEVGEDGSVKYFRSKDNSIHYVPKRALEDIVVE